MPSPQPPGSHLPYLPQKGKTLPSAAQNPDKKSHGTKLCTAFSLREDPKSHMCLELSWIWLQPISLWLYPKNTLPCLLQLHTQGKTHRALPSKPLTRLPRVMRYQVPKFPLPPNSLRFSDTIFSKKSEPGCLLPSQ